MAAIDGDNSVAFYHINTSEICPDKKEGWTLVESDFIRGKRGGGGGGYCNILFIKKNHCVYR